MPQNLATDLSEEVWWNGSCDRYSVTWNKTTLYSVNFPKLVGKLLQQASANPSELIPASIWLRHRRTGPAAVQQ